MDKPVPGSGGRRHIEPVIERRVSDKAFMGHYLLAIVAGILIAVVCFLIPPAQLWAFLGILPCLGVFAYARLNRMGNSYRLYPDRLEIESGLLSRTIENVQLFRVRDVGLRQGMVGRIADYGDVHLYSTDRTAPDIRIRSIDAPHQFYQQLRDLIAHSRTQNRALYLEEGGPLPLDTTGA